MPSAASCGMLAGMFGAGARACSRIVVPYTASVNCAFGLVSADVAHEYSTTTTCLPVPSAGRGQRASSRR